MSKVATAEKPAAASRTPVVSHRFGNISVAVFLREVTTADGKKFVAKDFVLQRSWRDKQGNWQDQSITLNSRDILAVQQALTQAFVESYDKADDNQE
jgi:hypothetical protein